MLGDRFYCSFNWEYNPMYIVDFDAIEAEIISRLPYLKNKPFKVFFPSYLLKHEDGCKKRGTPSR